MGFQHTEDLGKYLGVPIYHKRVGLNTFSYVIEKVKQRLSSWKSRTLSFAGRVTLAKSVVQAMPVYVMQSTVIPRGICDEIDKLCRNFIWGDSENHKAMHLLSWDKICKPKKQGGLGLRSTRAANSAFLLKGLWNFCVRPDNLWCSLLRHKYKCGWRSFPKMDSNRRGSNFWNGLIDTWEEFRRNLYWEIGNGEDIRFWVDEWLPNHKSLVTYCPSTINDDDQNLAIRHFTTYNGEWNLSLLNTVLPQQIIQVMETYPPPSILADEDKFYWGVTPDGSFTTKSAYLTLLESQTINTDRNYDYIWKWKGAERVRTFLWKLSHEAVLTNVERSRRMMSPSKACPLCDEADETLLHRFRDCSFSFVIWYGLNIQNQNQFFNNNSWVNWLESNLKTKSKKLEDTCWSLKFGCALDVIWRNRNDFVFNHKNQSTQNSIININHQFDSYCSILERGSSLAPQIFLSTENISDDWCPPAPGVWSLNCDAAVNSNGREAGCGGILRDHRGNFCFAFAKSLPPCNAMEAELRAILQGMIIAWNRGFTHLEINSDCSIAIDLVAGLRETDERNQGLVNEIHEIGDGELIVNWRKVKRSANRVADRLARYSFNCYGNLVIFDAVPDFLDFSITRDGAGLIGSSIQ